MKEELLDIIKCPSCSSCSKENFNLLKDETDSSEIRKGRLECGACRQTFFIKNGILDLLFKPSKEVLDETEGIEKAAKDYNPNHNDSMLLGLPESAETPNPLDAVYGYSLNFYKALECLNIAGNEFVLDLGSGNTWSANKLAQKGCKCVALDISVPKFKGLESADVYMKNNGVYYERIVSDMKNLPFIDGTFDIVMSNSSIHHSADLKAVLKEIKRILREKSRLILINEPVCGIFSLRRGSSRKRLPGFVAELHWTENIYSIFQYMRYIKKEGFSIKILHPPSIDKKLADLSKISPNFKNKGLKHRLGYLVSFFWGSDIFSAIFRKIMFWPAMVFFGLPLLLIAEKK